MPLVKTPPSAGTACRWPQGRSGWWRGREGFTSPRRHSLIKQLDAAVWSNNTVRVMARNISAVTVDLAAATLSVEATKRKSSP